MDVMSGFSGFGLSLSGDFAKNFANNCSCNFVTCGRVRRFKNQMSFAAFVIEFYCSNDK